MSTPKLPPLPETVYGLFYEAQASDDDEGYQELFDEPAYTADQMKTYARQAIAANTPAVPDVSGLLSEYDMEGSAFAVDLLAMLAASTRPQPVSKPDHPEQDLDMVARLEARLAWIEQKLFVSRWNGVIDSGAQTTWQIAPDWRHTVAKMAGHKFGDAIDAAIAAQEQP